MPPDCRGLGAGGEGESLPQSPEDLSNYTHGTLLPPVLLPPKVRHGYLTNCKTWFGTIAIFFKYVGIVKKIKEHYCSMVYCLDRKLLYTNARLNHT